MANLWDLRQPFTPIDKQEKGMRPHRYHGYSIMVTVSMVMMLSSCRLSDALSVA